jgi:hypothetical protein
MVHPLRFEEFRQKRHCVEAGSDEAVHAGLAPGGLQTSGVAGDEHAARTKRLQLPREQRNHL